MRSLLLLFVCGVQLAYAQTCNIPPSLPTTAYPNQYDATNCLNRSAALGATCVVKYVLRNAHMATVHTH